MPQALAVRTTGRGMHSVSAQAHVRAVDEKQPQAACRSPNRMHVPNARMGYLLLGQQPG